MNEPTRNQKGRQSFLMNPFQFVAFLTSHQRSINAERC
jgi:hypothetical protein